MSNWPVDLGFDQLKKNRELISSIVGANEATTRLRAIDTMLFDVLGWNKLEVDSESHYRAIGYSDYAIRCDGMLSMIIEAKREGVSFLLPLADIGAHPCGFALLAKECPEAESALRQAIGYAAICGARFVAITNGHQWIIAMTFVQNRNIDERLVLAFESLDAIENRFRQFWDAFSPAGIKSNRIIDLLLATRKAPPPSKLSQRIDGYPRPATRNALAETLGTILGAVWEEVKVEEAELAFLDQCYVVPEASSSAIALARELLEQKLASDERIHATPISSREAPNILTGYSPEKPIVVLGDVGSGKTIFLKHLRKIDAARVLDKYIQIDIDFIDRPESESEISGFIFMQIEEQLQRLYQIDLLDDTLIRGALNADLNRYKKSPEAIAFSPGTSDYVREELKFINSIRMNKHEFLKRVFVHLRGARQFSVALFFDNLDRRSPAIQEEAYLRASAIARDWACLVFVCLRPSTFYQSSKSGVLDSVAPKLISIVNPSASIVLILRLKFAKDYALGKALPSGSRAPLGSTFAFEMPKVAIFLECLTESFRHNAHLGSLFEAVSNRNTRELLKYTFDFMTSMHLDTNLIVDQFQEDRKYRVPIHHALRALLYGNFIHYDPKRSRFINLFDLQQANPQEHFTRLVVLHYLSKISLADPVFGFAKLGQLIGQLALSGYTNTHTLWTIRFLFERRCVESRDPLDEWTDDIRELRITDLGRHHVGRLVSSFNYVDAVTVDTPILEDEFRRHITDVFHIRARIERCIHFLDYLDRACNSILDMQTKQLWRESCENIRLDMAGIQDKLDKQDAEREMDDAAQ